MLIPVSSSSDADRLRELERAAMRLLAGLDELGQHQAAAYVAMGIDTMRRARQGPLPTA